jgi:hypothetical protein
MPSQFKEYEKVEPISGPEKSKGSTGADYSDDIKRSNFDTALEKADVSKVERREVAPPPAPIEPPQTQATKETLMDLAKKASQEVPKVAPTPSDLQTQATNLRQRMQKVETGISRIQNEKIDLPTTEVQKMNTFIEHIDQGLRDVTKLTKGVEIGAMKEIDKTKPPLVRFLSYLTDSDKKLNSFLDEIGGLKIGEQKLSPDVLIAVQIKLGFITQELEFFTATLNKALESTKTVMNVQI